MSDEVHLEGADLASAMAAWRAGVPSAVAYELPTSAEDAASAGVLAAMADWPQQHSLMATHRATAASQLHTATNATTGILTAADDEGAAQITKEA
jgi:hypothetical protein